MLTETAHLPSHPQNSIFSFIISYQFSFHPYYLKIPLTPHLSAPARISNDFVFRVIHTFAKCQGFGSWSGKTGGTLLQWCLFGSGYGNSNNVLSLYRTSHISISFLPTKAFAQTEATDDTASRLITVFSMTASFLQDSGNFYRLGQCLEDAYATVCRFVGLTSGDRERRCFCCPF